MHLVRSVTALIRPTICAMSLLALLTLSGKAEETAPLYKDAKAPVDQRVQDLLQRMTLHEKIRQLQGQTTAIKDYSDANLQKHCADGLGGGGPYQMPIEMEVRFRNAIQEFLLHHTRLGIPALNHDEGCHGLQNDQATSFPMPIGLSCSWDPELLERIYDTVGREMRSRGGQQALAPVLDVARDPRFGRIGEMYGEDPYLIGRLGAATVRGLQGGASGVIDDQHVMATLKHFAGHGTPEGGLNRSPFLGGMRQLHDVHLAPFAYVIANAHPAAIMPSYNEIDGVPSHANRWLLRDVLRGEMGFDGLIVSDYGGIERLQQVHHVAADASATARLALDAGLQMELSGGGCFATLEQQVEAKQLDVGMIDRPVAALLTAKFRLGLFEHPLVDADAALALAKRPESRALALEAARKSIVLLKNDQHLLPLNINAYKTIAVIGPNADIARLGGYSGTPLQSVSVLDGLRDRVGKDVKITHAQGCRILNIDHRNAFTNTVTTDKDLRLITAQENRPLIDEARQVAAAADLVVLVLGDTEQLCREAWGRNHLGDCSSLDLPGSQRDLAEAVLATGKPVVLYLMNGRPVTLGELGQRIPAILEGWYMGQETGTAVAEILCGDHSPSGKLTMSFPRSVGCLPVYYSKKNGAAEFGYLFHDPNVVYPFGFGLSYTTFSYQNVRLADARIARDGHTQVSVDVTNTGTMEADEIVQMYIHDEVASVTRPVKELKGFQRIHLKPGKTQTVSLPINADALSFYGLDMQRRVEPGAFTILVGSSSVDLASVVLTVSE